jgi:uncharacterized protein YbjT (DUF2867 family)
MILVTGAAGQSGNLVVRQFARHDVPVRALVRDRNRADGLLGLPGVEIVEGDMLRPRSLERALDGIERSLMISSADPSMLEAQCTFVDAARSAGVRHVIKFSGRESGIGFDQFNFRYSRVHQQIERYLEASGLAWTHLQPGQFMQVYLRQARAIATRGVFALPTAQISLAPVDVRDVAQVAFHILTKDGHEGRTYPMTGPQAMTMAEIATTISTSVGRPVAYRAVTPEESKIAMLANGADADFAEALYDQAVERLRHPQSHVWSDTHTTFGVTPTTFADFIADHRVAFTTPAPG